MTSLEPRRRTPRFVLACIGVGLAAGLLSGLFGVGGGTVIVPMLVLILAYGQKLASGTSLAAIVPTAASSTGSRVSLRVRLPMTSRIEARNSAYAAKTNGSAGDGNGFSTPVAAAVAARSRAAASEEVPAAMTRNIGRRTSRGRPLIRRKPTTIVATARSTYQGPCACRGSSSCMVAQIRATARYRRNPRRD